jgi:hypothetical protein
MHVGELPEQAPLQPVKAYPSPGLAVRTSDELCGSVAVQVGGQLMSGPPTVPLPEIVTVSCCVWDEAAQAALRRWSPAIVTVHETLVPEQAPLQPLKTCPPPGVSRTVNVEPVSTVDEHALWEAPDPQLIAPPVTEPLPEKVTPRLLVVVGGPVKFAVMS